MDLATPPEVGGALAVLLNAGRPGLIAGSPTVQPLDVYQGAQVTVSIDSATLADGKFIGADTQNMFDALVAEDKAKKKFFKDLVGWISTEEPQAQIEQALTKRKASADAAQSFETEAAFTESNLAQQALLQIQHFGMASLTRWAAKENAALAAKPNIHE